MDNVNVVLVTQARLKSTRFPDKVLKEIDGVSMLGLHLRRLKKVKLAQKVVVATTMEEGVENILKIAENEQVGSFQGSLTDVLDRFYQAAIVYNPDYVVRVTSDCPLIDPELIDEVIKHTISGGFDYSSNTITEDYPDGQDVEVFKMDVLKEAWQEATLLSEREHVTPFIRKNCDVCGGERFVGSDYLAPANYNKIRMTVDQPEDLEVVSWLITGLGADRPWQDYVKYMIDNPDRLVNAEIVRNEGYLISKSKD